MFRIHHTLKLVFLDKASSMITSRFDALAPAASVFGCTPEGEEEVAPAAPAPANLTLTKIASTAKAGSGKKGKKDKKGKK